MKAQRFCRVWSLLCVSLALPVCAQVTNFQRVHSFGNVDLAGAYPEHIIEGSDGRLYGIASLVQFDRRGVVYSIRRDGTDFRILHRFIENEPTGSGLTRGLLEGSDGALYGITRGGAAYGQGAVFKINKDGSGLSVLYAFRGWTNGDVQNAQGPLIERNDGALYGASWGGGFTNRGTVFKLRKDGSQFQLLRQFGGVDDGWYPQCGLTADSDGWLYGTTSGGGTAGRGTIFKIRMTGADYQIISHLPGSSNGPAEPNAELLEDSEGLLYGTSRRGGTDWGTVFRLQKDGGGLVVLRSFDAPDDPRFPVAPLVTGTDGVLYGTSGQYGSNTVFKLNRDGSGFRVIRRFPSSEGWDLAAPLVLSRDGLFYTSSQYGGQYGEGALIRFNPNEEEGYSTIWNFSKGGGEPYGAASAVAADGAGKLYGSTIVGGSKNKGVIYQVAENGVGFRVLRDVGVTTNEGAAVQGLMFASDRNLYGTASQEGAGRAGTLFKVATDGSGFTLLHTFGLSTNDGSGPLTPVVEAADGKLYGTTRQGGPGYSGTIYRINKDGSGYEILRSFAAFGGDGRLLQDALIEGSDGVLYGVSPAGGAYNAGIVFRINRDGSGYRQLRSLGIDSGDARYPTGRLLEGSDGFLYGVTFASGAENTGAVFKLSKDGQVYAIIKTFVNSVGTGPSGGLWEGNDRALYGSTQNGGSYDGGVLFKIRKDGNGFAVLHHFDGGPRGGHILYPGITCGGDGAFYGTAWGGELGLGVVFRYGHMIGLTKAEAPVQLSCTGIPGYSYRIFRSTDLRTWTILGAFAVGNNTPVGITDPVPPTSAAFYRAVPTLGAP